MAKMNFQFLQLRQLVAYGKLNSGLSLADIVIKFLREKQFYWPVSITRMERFHVYQSPHSSLLGNVSIVCFLVCNNFPFDASNRMENN